MRHQVPKLLKKGQEGVGRCRLGCEVSGSCGVEERLLDLRGICDGVHEDVDLGMVDTD
jgi:hypothetical protein